MSNNNSIQYHNIIAFKLL